MPNWVKNKVRFASKRVIKECYGEENGEGYFDFNKIIPMPKSLNIPSGGSENISIMYALKQMDEFRREEILNKLKEAKTDFYGSYYNQIFKYRKEYTDEEYEREIKELDDKIKGCKKDTFDETDYKGLGITTLADLGNMYINNILEYGADSWYDWCNKYWDTKWNACHVYYIDENNIEFDCAWSCPYNVLKEISKKYATRVEVDFADEDIGSNCGRIVFENGNEIYYYEGDSKFAYNVWEYTEEEIAELEAEE